MTSAEWMTPLTDEELVRLEIQLDHAERLGIVPLIQVLITIMGRALAELRALRDEKAQAAGLWRR